MFGVTFGFRAYAAAAASPALAVAYAAAAAALLAPFVFCSIYVKRRPNGTAVELLTESDECQPWTRTLIAISNVWSVADPTSRQELQRSRDKLHGLCVDMITSTRVATAAYGAAASLRAPEVIRLQAQVNLAADEIADRCYALLTSPHGRREVHKPELEPRPWQVSNTELAHPDDLK